MGTRIRAQSLFRGIWPPAQQRVSTFGQQPRAHRPSARLITRFLTASLLGSRRPANARSRATARRTRKKFRGGARLQRSAGTGPGDRRPSPRLSEHRSGQRWIDRRNCGDRAFATCAPGDAPRQPWRRRGHADGTDVCAELRGDYIVTFDADGQHRVDDAVALLHELASGKCDVVYGSRFLGRPSIGMPATRRCILKAAAWFSRVTTHARLTDAHNGLRGFTRKAAAALEISQTGMAYASEITSKLVPMG